jgi:hypothetical protein
MEIVAERKTTKKAPAPQGAGGSVKRKIVMPRAHGILSADELRQVAELFKSLRNGTAHGR